MLDAGDATTFQVLLYMYTSSVLGYSHFLMLNFHLFTSERRICWLEEIDVALVPVPISRGRIWVDSHVLNISIFFSLSLSLHSGRNNLRCANPFQPSLLWGSETGGSIFVVRSNIHFNTFVVPYEGYEARRI